MGVNLNALHKTSFYLGTLKYSCMNEVPPPEYGNPIRGDMSSADSLLYPNTMDGSPTTFGRSMRLHLDDVRFDDPCSTNPRPGFCAAESKSRLSLDQDFLAHTSSKSYIPQLANHHGASHDTLANESSTHISNHFLEPAEAISRSQARKNKEQALEFDSFLRQPTSILIRDKDGRHRSVSPMRRVSVALSTLADRPKPPTRHRSVSPMRRCTSAAASAHPSCAEAPVMEREQTVYTAQVATALTTGKPVWL
jgi:hypothetical protein